MRTVSGTLSVIMIVTIVNQFGETMLTVLLIAVFTRNQDHTSPV